MAKKRSSSNSSDNDRNPSADAAPSLELGANVEPGADSPDDTDAQTELEKRYGPDAPIDAEGTASEFEDAAVDQLAQKLDETAELKQANLEPDLEERSEKQPDDLPATVAKVKTGRGVAWFSLLLALASLGGAGYMYYELIYQQPMQQLTQQMTEQLTSKVDQAMATVRGGESASDDKFSELRSSLAELQAQQNSALKSLATEQAEQLASTEAGLMTSLNKVANAAPPSEAQWKLAELEYLLRIANHRVLMEADANGALQVLSTADAILRELDDFGLHGVRAQITDEILALKQVRGADIQGLFLRLEALKRQLGELPLRAPEFNAASNQTGAEAVEESGSTAAEPSVLAAMQAKISGYVQFRRLQTPVKPLLGPDETMYLELNLRMMLERAQLAALRQQQEVYSQSLSSAQAWLEQYLDPESADVAALVDEIDGLLEVDLVRELPDISGSLRSLLATQRGSS
jgi:uroporphyrin-3 C-methyltransferase